MGVRRNGKIDQQNVIMHKAHSSLNRVYCIVFRSFCSTPDEPVHCLPEIHEESRQSLSKAPRCVSTTGRKVSLRCATRTAAAAFVGRTCPLGSEPREGHSPPWRTGHCTGIPAAP